jgi:hypothetical protein
MESGRNGGGTEEERRRNGGGTEEDRSRMTRYTGEMLEQRLIY